MPDRSATISPHPVLACRRTASLRRRHEASCAFFTGKLGFRIAFTYGEPPFYPR